MITDSGTNMKVNVRNSKSKCKQFPNVFLPRTVTFELYPPVPFRMNSARIKGYEADVGTRTTHRIMYPESAVDLDNTTHLLLFPFKIQDLEWLTKALSTGFSGQ